MARSALLLFVGTALLLQAAGQVDVSIQNGAAATQEVSGSSQVTFSTSSLSELPSVQQELSEVAEQAFANLTDNASNLNQVVQQLTVGLAQTVASILIQDLQESDLNITLVAESVSQSIGQALGEASENVGGSLRTLNTEQLEQDVFEGIIDVYNVSLADTDPAKSVEQILLRVMTIIGEELARVTGGEFSANISVNLQFSAAVINIQRVELNVTGKALEIYDLMVQGLYEDAGKLIIEVLLEAGDDEIKAALQQALVNNQTDILVNTIVVVYEIAEPEYVSRFTNILGELYIDVDFEQAIIDILSQVFYLINLSGNLEALSIAIIEGFINQGQSIFNMVNISLTQAIANQGCEAVAQLLSTADKSTQVWQRKRFVSLVQQNPEIERCLEVGVQLGISVELQGKLRQLEELVTEVNTNILDNNTIAISDLLVKLILDGEDETVEKIFEDTLCNETVVESKQFEETLTKVIDTGDEQETNLTKILGESLQNIDCPTKNLSVKILLETAEEAVKGACDSNFTLDEYLFFVEQQGLDLPDQDFIEQCLVEPDVLTRFIPPPTPEEFIPLPEPEPEVGTPPVPCPDNGDLDECVKQPPTQVITVPEPEPEPEPMSPPPPPPSPPPPSPLPPSPSPPSPSPPSPMPPSPSPSLPPPSPLPPSPSPPPPPPPPPSPMPPSPAPPSPSPPSPSPPPPQVCPPVRTELLVELSDGTKYYFGYAQMYEDAKLVCECIDANLVVFGTQYEESFVSAAHELQRQNIELLGIGTPYYEYWMGLYNPEGEMEYESWVWVDGSNVTYNNWKWDQPTYVADGKYKEECANVETNYTDCYNVKIDRYNAWSDQRCENHLSFICETVLEPRLKVTNESVAYAYVAPLDQSYVLFTEKMYSWSSAKQTCEYIGGRMITYSDVVEEELVMGALGHVFPDYAAVPIWIGLYREGPECNCGCRCLGKKSCGCELETTCGCLKTLGDFYWVGGRPLGKYTNWMGTPCGYGDSYCVPDGQCVLTRVKKTPYTLQAQWLPQPDCGLMAHALCEVDGLLTNQPLLDNH
eukprot:TRINITY_DN1487_c1_g1_i5.p1 TRINITY_DN1487_c1_g1~~TRINITY_DN1487_c1_g1_i5.p1  ORF type:complete len:1043 (-),score=184.89 TRINITY_DN1487_c1_g1_i5:525-3653(-)